MDASAISSGIPPTLAVAGTHIMPRKTVSVECRGPVYVLRMRNNDNVFSDAFIHDLNDALDCIESMHGNAKDGAVVSVSDHDRVFSNGLDLLAAKSAGRDYFVQFQALLNRLLTFRLPTVACINGHAFAGGLMFALAHDYRWMRSDRGFCCMNEVDMPSPLTAGMLAVISSKVPHPTVFRDMILQGKRFTAEESLNSQIVDGISPSAEQTLHDAIQLALKWSSKAKAGIVYHQLKAEMYASASRLLLDCNLGFVKSRL